jgi:signal transduction histidine kinase
MTAHEPSSSALADARVVLLVGAMPELDGISADMRLVRWSPDEPLDGIAASVLVLDLRELPVEVLSRIRHGAPLSQVPALVVVDDDLDDELLHTLDADDVLRLPASRGTIARRLATLDELGRSRLALREAESVADALHRRLLDTLKDAQAQKEFEAERRRFERLVAMGTMVAGFAHEIRNPVAALLSMVEEIAEELASAGLELPHVERMVQILQRIERLVRTSLQFGRPATPRRARHRPWSIITQAVAEVGPRTRAAGQELEVDIEGDLPDVFCDDGQIAQALAILLNNALDAAGSPSGVRIRATLHRSADDARSRRTPAPPRSGGWVRLEVIDNGLGIPFEVIGRIFDPFFTTKAAGTGLGLSIAQQVVQENGGRLDVSSTRGGPTAFAILVPAES